MKKRRKLEFDEDRMKLYMSLSAEQKLSHLEELNAFLEAITPKRAKRVWKSLKEKGW